MADIQQACATCVFVEYELSEGEATSLLIEREARLNALGWRLWRACSNAEDILGITANVPGLADAMNAWKANAFPEPTRSTPEDAASGTGRGEKLP